MGNVDNTSDVDKPLSVATSNALAVKADKTYVDEALSTVSGGQLKVYKTLTEANSDIANIPKGVLIRVLDPIDGGDYYKELDSSITLKKSPYDALMLSKKYTDSEVDSKLYKDYSNYNSISLTYMDNLYKVIGDINQGTSTDGATQNYTYIFNKSVTEQKEITSIAFDARTNNVVFKLKIYKKINSNFVFLRDVVILNSYKVGVNLVNLGNSSFTINSGEYIGISLPSGSGQIGYTRALNATSHPMYFSKQGTDQQEVPDTNGGNIAQIYFGAYTENNSVSVTDALLQIKETIGGSHEFVGCHRNTPRRGSDATNAQWIYANEMKASGTINTFNTYSQNVGNIDLVVYKKTGVNSFVKKEVKTVKLTNLGLNNFFGLDISFEKGDYLGIITGAVGLTQYIKSSDTNVAFPIQSHSDFEADTGFSPPNHGFEWQWCYGVTYNHKGEIADNVGKWDGKKYTSFGDSITWYNGRNFVTTHKEAGQIVKGYQSYVVDELGCTLDNKGESGWDMTQIYTSRIQPYDFKDCYITTITSGANDCRKGIPVGVIQPIGSVFNTSTYAGAMQAAIEKVIASNPNTKIVLITPIRGWYSEYNTSNVPNTDPTVVGLMKREYPDMVKSIAKLYGVPFVDFYDDLLLNDLNKNHFLGDDPTKFTAYLLHPTNQFFGRMGEMLLKTVRNF